MKTITITFDAIGTASFDVQVKNNLSAEEILEKIKKGHFMVDSSKGLVECNMKKGNPIIGKISREIDYNCTFDNYDVFEE